MKTRAAVALEVGKPLSIEELDLEGPQTGEVLVEIKATGVCSPSCSATRARASCSRWARAHMR